MACRERWKLVFEPHELRSVFILTHQMALQSGVTLRQKFLKHPGMFLNSESKYTKLITEVSIPESGSPGDQLINYTDRHATGVGTF